MCSSLLDGLSNYDGNYALCVADNVLGFDCSVALSIEANPNGQQHVFFIFFSSLQLRFKVGEGLVVRLVWLS